MSEGINLLDPDKKSENLLPAKRMQFMRFFAIGMLIVVGGSAFVLFMLVSLSPLPQLQKQEQSLRLTLSESSGDMAKLAVLNERTDSINSLLKKRKSYDEVLTLLQEKLPSNANISAIRVEQKILIVTVDSKSLASLDTFLNSLISYVEQKKAFTRVTMTSLATDDVRNDYSLTVSLVML